MIVGSLGDIVFEASSSKVFTPQAFSMDRDMRYEDHEPHGTWQRPEYLAPNLASASLSITLRADLGCDPAADVDRLENSMIKGEVMRLVIGGKNLGRWTIRKVGQQWRHMLKGIPALAISLELELKEYV